MRCLVTGATGFVGSHLVDALVARGDDVTCLVRPTSDRRWIETHAVRFVVGGLDDPAVLDAAARGQDVVFHVAGVIKARTAEAYFRANAEGTRAVVEACRRAGPGLRRLVYVSSLAATGASPDGKPVDEDTPCRPVSPYGESKLAGERIVLEAARDLPVTAVRPPVVFGPRDRETLTFFKTVAFGIRPTVGVLRELGYVFVSDLVAGLLLAAEHPAAAGRVYFLCNDGPRAYGDVLAAVARALGKRWTLPLHVPAWTLYAAAFCAEAAGAVMSRHPMFNRRKVREINQRCWTCAAERAKRELGFAPRLSLQEGMDGTARWYREHGWL